jgi:hypothetical protein
MRMETGQLRLSIYVHETKGSFWAYCPEFDLVASGHSADEAHQALLALIDDYVTQVQRMAGDRPHVRLEPEDWDSALITGALNKDRILN